MPASHEEKIRLKLVIDPGDAEKQAVEATKRGNERSRREGRTPRTAASDEGARETRSRRSRLSDEERDARAAQTARRQFLHAQAGLANAVLRLGSITRALHNPLHALLELNRITHHLRAIGGPGAAARQTVTQTAAQTAAQVTREVSRQLSRPLTPLHAQMPQSASEIARETSRLVRTIDRTAPTVTGEAKRRGLTSLAPILGRLAGDEYERPVNTNSPRPAFPPAITAYRQLPRFKSILQQMNTNVAAGPPPSLPPPIPPIAGAGGTGGAGGAGGIRGLLGGLGGSGGAGALAGGAIAIAVVLELRNVAKGLQSAVRGWAQIGSTFATANASSAIHGGLSLYQGAARIGLGPIVGPIVSGLVGVGHKLIDVLDELTRNLAKYNPITAAGAARLAMTQKLFQFRMAQVFEPIITGWQNIKISVLDSLAQLAPIIRPAVVAIGAGLQTLAQFIRGFVEFLKATTAFGLFAGKEPALSEQAKQMNAAFIGGLRAIPQNGQISRPMPSALRNVFTGTFGTGNAQQRFAEIDTLEMLIQSTREALKGETDQKKRAGYYATLQSALLKESRLIASLGGSFVVSDRNRRIEKLKKIEQEIGFLEYNRSQGQPVDEAKLAALRKQFGNIAAGMKLSDAQAQKLLRDKFGDDSPRNDVAGHVPRPAFNPAPGPPVQVPVPNLDIRQKVEFRLEQKISAEQDVSAAVRQVQDKILNGYMAACDESRLALSMIEGHLSAAGVM